MATYVNDLRLKEIATGDEAGTWGTSTNTNLELIGEALGYGTEAVADASTHTITMADGATDGFRCTFLRLTGGGQVCTVTLAPNTLSHTWIIRNTTSYALTFSQGSGANVTIAAGQAKIVTTDGLGSGAVVYECLEDLELGGTLTVGIDDTGQDVKFFGATSGKYWLWDESADGVVQQGTLTVGVDDTGYDVKFFGATTGKSLLWDESADSLIVTGTIDATTVEFDSLSGTGAVAVTNILDEDNLSSDSATALSTQQSIKAYVDAQVGTVDTLAEVLANGNTTGGTDIATTTTDKVQFRDSAIYINSSTDGQLDIVADTEVQLAATTVDLNGNLDVSGTALVTGVLTTTATQVATGGITSGSDILSDADSTDSLGSTAVRWLKGWFDTLTAGTLTIGSGSVTDSSGAISFDDENLTTTGIVTAAGTSVFTNLDISGDIDVDGTANLDIVDIDGAVDVGGRVSHSIITTLSSDGTPSVSAGNYFVTGDTTTITDFDDGVVGQTIRILAEHAKTITDNAAIILDGSVNFVMADGDTLTLTMFNDQVWQETGRATNVATAGGTSVGILMFYGAQQ